MDPDFTVSSTMDQTSDQDPENEQNMSEWMPSGNGLISGLFGLNVVLLGGALLAGRALAAQEVLLWEPEVLLLFLMVLSVVWILWFILWGSKKPGSRPHQDHHAGGITVMLVLLLFTAFTVLLCLFIMGLIITLRPCKPLSNVISPMMEIIFLCLQTYLLWAHSKDCIHLHKIFTRGGLMVILCTDLLLWLNAVTDDTIHEAMELEKEDGQLPDNYTLSLDVFSFDSPNSSACLCNSNPACLIFQKGYEVLYPFSMEYYLMSGCMIYVMWKNVGRTLTSGHHHGDNKLTIKIVYSKGIIYGFIFGGLVLITGIVVFILYQVWVGQSAHRLTAFLLFYGYHLAVMPLMTFCSLLGLLVHRFEKRIHEGGHNPTRSLDVLLLIITAMGQLAMSYFSLVAAIAIGTGGILGDLDLSYSVLSLLELVMQNIFIIEGLHRHPTIKVKKKPKSTMFKLKKKSSESEERKAGLTLLEGNTTAPPAAPEEESKNTWSKIIIQEICAFLVLSNIMLWIIPAFGVHPQSENGLGKQFFGFSCWFVLVNLGQPLSVFYRMHSVAALMELLITAK